MVNAVRAAKDAGVRTGLISNSWGKGRYDRSQFPELFDGVVISGEVGLRKPAPASTSWAPRRSGCRRRAACSSTTCAGNLKPAARTGNGHGASHRDAEATIPRLEALLGVSLR